MQTLHIATPDGACPTELFGGGGPGVVLVMDAGGPRPALRETAEVFARAGYTVAMPDLMYRVGSPFDLLPAGAPRTAPAFFAAMGEDAGFRKALFETYVPSANTPAHVERDFGAILPALAGHAAPGPVRLIGYCMGGGIALRVAARFPDRVCAAASFHGGFLATDAPTSVHRELPAVRAEVLIAGADEDPSYSPEIRDRLAAALVAAGTRHTIETWPGRHGFAVNDTPSYDAALYERHLAAALALFAR